MLDEIVVFDTHHLGVVFSIVLYFVSTLVLLFSFVDDKDRKRDV